GPLMDEGTASTNWRRTDADLMEEARRIYEKRDRLAQHSGNFRSGHFPEPNIISDVMSSLTKLGEETTFAASQIQSDWSQKIRDMTRDAVARQLFDPNKPEVQARIQALDAPWKAAQAERDAWLMAEPLTWLREIGSVGADEKIYADEVASDLAYISQG